MTAQLGDSTRTIDSRESYEQTYNTGCYYDCVGDCVGDWVAAKEALTSDEKAAREDKDKEMVGIIKVQLGYVM